MRRSIMLPIIALALLIGCPKDGAAQTYYNVESYRIEQLVAPVALYPDQLLAQIMAASLYPQQIAEANQWISRDYASGYSNQDTINDLSRQPWDSSVKSLTAFPQVLRMMNDNPDWTRQISSLYIAQRDDMMDSIQTLRQHALDTGALYSSTDRVVYNQDGNICIATTDSGNIQSPVVLASYNTTTSGYPPYTLYTTRTVPTVRIVPFIVVRSFWDNHNWGWRGHRVAHRPMPRPHYVYTREVMHRPQHHEIRRAPVIAPISITFNSAPRKIERPHTTYHRTETRPSRHEVRAQPVVHTQPPRHHREEPRQQPHVNRPRPEAPVVRASAPSVARAIPKMIARPQPEARDRDNNDDNDRRHSRRHAY